MVSRLIYWESGTPKIGLIHKRGHHVSVTSCDTQPPNSLRTPGIDAPADSTPSCQNHNLYFFTQHINLYLSRKLIKRHIYAVAYHDQIWSLRFMIFEHKYIEMNNVHQLIDRLKSQWWPTNLFILSILAWISPYILEVSLKVVESAIYRYLLYRIHSSYAAPFW